MSNALVIYASTHGHTAKIAAAVARALGDGGVSAQVHDAAAGSRLDPAEYDLVVVGASIHAGHYQREIVDWVRRHHLVLGAMPAAFFSVCLTAAEDSGEAQEATSGYIDDFLADTGWTPRRTQTFAGALEYREYDFFTRLVMRLMKIGRAHV